MNRYLTRKSALIVAAVCAAIVFCYQEAQSYRHDNAIERELQEYNYRRLTTQRLQSEWDCLPDTQSARAAFILKLVKRFSGDDYVQMERGWEWIREYKQKQLAGSLTVDERKKAQYSTIAQSTPPSTISDSGKNYCHAWTVSSQVAWSTCSPFLTLQSCALEKGKECPSSYSFSANSEYGNANILFESQGLSWHVDSRDWPKLVKQEYEALRDKDARIAELEEYEKRDKAMLYAAREQVAKMSADEVSSYQEEVFVRREHMKLKCR